MKRTIYIYPFFVFLALSVIFFSPLFLYGKAFLAADNLYRFYPWKAFAPVNYAPKNTLITDPLNDGYAANYNRQLKQGKLNKWNPYILGGVPGNRTVSMGAPGQYYPLKYVLHTFFSTHTALTLLLFAHVALMGYFMYLYLLEIGAGWRGALFGGVVYMFNGCAMVWLEFETWVAVGALLPLMLLFFEKLLTARKYYPAFAAGMVFGLMLLTGGQQLVVYVSLLILFYLLFIFYRQYKNNNSGREVIFIVSSFAVTGITGGLIGAVDLIPFIEVLSDSFRIERSFSFDQLFDFLGRVPFRYLVTLIFPDFFGSPLLHFNLIPRLPSQSYMNYNELCLYMGVPTLFAFLSCITSPKNQFSNFYLFLTFLFIAMMTGTVFYYPFFKLFPGMDKMNPTRIIFLFVFAFSVAAGMGIHALEGLSKKMRNVYAGLVVTTFLLIVSLALFSCYQTITVWFNQEYFNPLKPLKMNFLNRMIELRSLSSPAIYKPLILASFAFGLFMLYAFLQNRKTKLVVIGLLLSILAYDLISFGRAYNTSIEPQHIYPRTPAIEFLMEQPRPFRVVQDTGNSLYVNTLAPFELEEIGGYAGVYSERINKLMSYSQVGDRVFEGARYGRWVMFERFSSKFFDLMNVRYVLTAPDIALQNPKYKLVLRKDLAIYENTQVMPRAYAVYKYTVKENMRDLLDYMGSDAFEMRHEVVLEKEPSPEFISRSEVPSVPPEVTIDEYSPDKVTLTVDLSENGWLVLTDSFYPGWKAREHGAEVEILRANCNYRAVALEAGKHTVTFSYEPYSFYLGSILTVIGVVLAISGFIVSRFRDKK